MDANLKADDVVEEEDGPALVLPVSSLRCLRRCCVVPGPTCDSPSPPKESLCESALSPDERGGEDVDSADARCCCVLLALVVLVLGAAWIVELVLAGMESSRLGGEDVAVMCALRAFS